MTSDQKSAAVHAVTVHDELVEYLADWVTQFGCNCRHPACRNCKATNEANRVLANAKQQAVVVRLSPSYSKWFISHPLSNQNAFPQEPAGFSTHGEAVVFAEQQGFKVLDEHFDLSQTH